MTDSVSENPVTFHLLDIHVDHSSGFRKNTFLIKGGTPLVMSGGRLRTGLLVRGRKWFGALAFVAISLPLLVGIVSPDDPTSVLKEGRKPAPLPSPHTFTDWMWLTRSFDAFLRDHFGLRERMLSIYHAMAGLTSNLMLENPLVLIGHDGRMFYLGDEMVRQSVGLVRRDARVAESADLLAGMKVALQKRGINFLVAVPANSSTVYEDELPAWAQNPGRTTEYDLLLRDLHARGVMAVDLRPALKSARQQGKIYLRYDTHWTPRGAIAGFNAVVEADGHLDWRIDPATALGPPTVHKGGDTARVAGVQDQVTEMLEWFSLPGRASDQPLTKEIMPDHLVATGKEGPTIMVIGDSFTHSYFPFLLSQHVERVVWIHHRHCGFDWSLIDKFRPSEVWWAPAERFALCDSGVRPANYPS